MIDGLTTRGDAIRMPKKIKFTPWHDSAAAVTSRSVVGHPDDQKWFESTDLATFPRGPVHPVIQLDRFPQGDSPEPSELQVDRMRSYQ